MRLKFEFEIEWGKAKNRYAFGHRRELRFRIGGFNRCWLAPWIYRADPSGLNGLRAWTLHWLWCDLSLQDWTNWRADAPSPDLAVGAS